jgi:hypothetical protein
MSIATLKRKTAAKYHNSSVDLPAFSINGTRRSQGYIGQTMLSRSLPRTPMKGNTMKGHGGCCGTYPIGNVIQSAVTSLNNPTVVKPSVLGTDGLISTKYRWIRRGYPFSSTKQDTNLNSNTAQDYIDKLKIETIQESCHVDDDKIPVPVISSGCDTAIFKGGNLHSRIGRQARICPKPVSKPPTVTGAIDQSVHIMAINKKCWEFFEQQRTNSITQKPIVSST